MFNFITAWTHHYLTSGLTYFKLRVANKDQRLFEKLLSTDYSHMIQLLYIGISVEILFKVQIYLLQNYLKIQFCTHSM